MSAPPKSRNSLPPLLLPSPSLIARAPRAPRGLVGGGPRDGTGRPEGAQPRTSLSLLRLGRFAEIGGVNPVAIKN
eukprot:3927551-Pyramimonas_sp.AAC.1